MLAVLLSSKMDPFYSIIGSFPTAIWTFFLVIFLFYWIIAVLGFISIDIIDIDIDPTQEGTSALVGLFLRFGLVGVPLTISLSIVSFIGWFLCFYCLYITPDFIRSSWMIWPYGLLVLLITGYIALWLTGYLIKPLARILPNTRLKMSNDYVGHLAKVRTSRVDADFGEAHLVDGGAGLIVKVRCDYENTIQCGDVVVVLEYDKARHVYKVAAVDESDPV